MKLVEILEKQKREKKIKWYKIAEFLGITRITFQYHLKNARNGKNTFSVQQVEKIAEYLGENPAIFFDN